MRCHSISAIDQYNYIITYNYEDHFIRYSDLTPLLQDLLDALSRSECIERRKDAAEVQLILIESNRHKDYDHNNCSVIFFRNCLHYTIKKDRKMLSKL